MADYAQGGYVAGPGIDHVPVRLSPCETFICHDGTIRRNGVIVGFVDMAAMRVMLERINQRQDERGLA